MNITLRGVVGYEITADGVRQELERAGGADIAVDLETPGGFVSEGISVYNQLRGYPGKVSVRMVGDVSSMGTYIAMAGDTREVFDNVSFMIHNPHNFAAGDYKVMAKNADYLRRLAGLLSSEYARVTKIPQDDVQGSMDETTYYIGQEIVDAGFADALIKRGIGGHQSGSDVVATRDSTLARAQAAYEDCVARINADGRAGSDMERAVAMLPPEAKVSTYDASAKLVDEPWSASESEKRWRDHVSVDSNENLPNNRYSKRFAFVSDAAKLTGHHFPIWDYKSGEFVNIAAVRNGLARLGNSTSVPSNDKPAVERLLRRYLGRYNKAKGSTESQQPPADAGQEVNMPLDEIMAKDPAVKAEVDQITADARAAGAAVVEARVKAAKPILDSGSYPAPLKALAVKVVSGEASTDSLTAAVAAYDAMKAQGDFGGEGAEETPGQNPPAVAEDGTVASEAEYQAAIARSKGEGGAK